MTLYKVTINRKIAEEWRGRFEASEGVPIVAGSYLFDADQVAGLKALLISDIDNYLNGFGDKAEWRDLALAAQRQLTKLNKVTI